MHVMPNFNMNTPEDLVLQRLEMIQAKERGGKVVNILNKSNISKPLFYKFYNRYLKYGKLGLYNLSKAPHNHGRRTSIEKEEYLHQLYKEYPYFSSYELYELVDIPPSTIQRIFKRNNLVKVYKPKSEKKRILERLKKDLPKRKRMGRSAKKF